MIRLLLENKSCISGIRKTDRCYIMLVSFVLEDFVLPEYPQALHTQISVLFPGPKGMEEVRISVLPQFGHLMKKRFGSDPAPPVIRVSACSLSALFSFMIFFPSEGFLCNLSYANRIKMVRKITALPEQEIRMPCPSRAGLKVHGKSSVYVLFLLLISALGAVPPGGSGRYLFQGFHKGCRSHQAPAGILYSRHQTRRSG